MNNELETKIDQTMSALADYVLEAVNAKNLSLEVVRAAELLLHYQMNSDFKKDPNGPRLGFATGSVTN